MATCLGHKYGTGCYKNSKSPRAKNWIDYQLCHKCYCVLITKTKPRKGHGGKYLTENPIGGMSLIALTK